MAIISVRLPENVHKKLEERIKKQGFKDKSEFIRNLIEKEILLKEDNTDLMWKVKIWSFFGITESQFNYAFKNSYLIEDFFSKVSKWSKIPIKVIYNPEEINISFKFGDEEIFIRRGRNQDRKETLISIVEELEEKVLGAFYA